MAQLDQVTYPLALSLTSSDPLPVTSPTITSPEALKQLCVRLQSSPVIGIDTEFVSEDTYHPELCLIQVATADDMAAIDPFVLKDLDLFWQTMVSGEHVTVLHAGREELNFFLRAVGEVPKQVFDVQIAAGFCSNEYPSSYSTVVNRFVGHQPAKGEQRTDWRRRPLTKAQIAYALEDVRYLLPLWERLTRILAKLNRRDWFQQEMDNWQNEVIAANSRKDWRRVSGIGKLNGRSLAIVRELWVWRQQEAQRRNQPPKRILRDDLLVEIAKRKVDSPDRIMGIRGIERTPAKRKAQELAECVQRGLEGPTERLHEGQRNSDLPTQLNLLGQFLAPALGTICRRAEIATSMVGTASDVRELIAFRMGLTNGNGDVPALAQGWRAEVVGNVIDELLSGQRSIRIEDPRAEDPLVFDPVDAD